MKGDFMKKSLISIVEILVNLAMIPMFFIRFFTDMGYEVGLLNTNELAALKVLRHYNMIENLETWSLLYAVPVTIWVIICSIVLSILSMVLKEKTKLGIISHVVFGISAIMFLLLLWFAASPDRIIL